MILRNLQQQVGKNKVDIASLAAGIKVKGFGNEVPELQPGESWLKGTGPYHLIMCTEAGNVDLGEFPAKGPQGIPGEQGDAAELGTVSATTETIEAGLDAMATVEKDGTNLLFKFELPQGERGVKGDKGDKGDQGPQGIQGKQGPQGLPSPIATLQGTFSSAEQLPNPSTVPSSYAYLVGSNGNYTIYAKVNGAWEDIGNFESIPGPQGPKGDSYGTFTKTVANGNELRTVLTNLTPSQSIVGAYATTGSNEEQLIVLAYDKNQMVYAYSSATDYPDVPTTVTWQAVTSSDSDGKFEVSGGYADSVTLYVYDERESLMDKVGQVIYPSLAGPFKQMVVPTYSSLGDIPTKATEVSSAFNLGAWDARPIAHRGDFVAFAFIGGHLNAITASYDFNIHVWTWKEATPLSKGCQVVLEDSQEGHVYLVAMETQSNPASIYNAVKPIVGKIPLEIALSGNTASINYLHDCDIKIRPSASVFITLTAYSTRNCSVTVDSSLITPDSGGKARINFAANGTAMRWPKPMKMTINQLIPGTWANVSEAKNDFEFDPFSSGSIIQQSSGVPSGDPTTQLEASYKLKDPALKFDDGSQYRLNFQVDFINTTPEISFPMVYEEA